MVIFLSSCGPRLEEVITEKFPNGSPKQIEYYSGEGEQRYLAKITVYYENGQKRQEGSYNPERKKHGKWTSWYENGNKWSEGYFFEGLNDKKHSGWHENGELHFTGRLDKGKRIGVWKFYDDKGNLAKEVDYDKAVPESGK